MDEMICNCCDFVFDELYCFKVYEAPQDYYCAQCYSKVYELKEGIEDEFQAERRD